jgi:hypothetical protein
MLRVYAAQSTKLVYIRGAMSATPNDQPNSAPHPAALWRHPLFGLLIGLGLLLLAATGWRMSGQTWEPGSPAEPLYRLDGFGGVETGPYGPFRWTAPQAALALPGAGPGPLTLHLHLFDAAPAPRALRLTLDGQEIYRGQTEIGHPWTLDLPVNTASTTPDLALTTAAWTPPGDRRELGVALTGLDIRSPLAAARAVAAQAALVLAVLILVGAAARRVGPVPAGVAGLGALGFLGPLLAYGDGWLIATAPFALAAALGAAWWLARREAPAIQHSELPPSDPRPPTPDPQHATRNTQHAFLIALIAGLLLFTLGRFNTGDAEAMYQITAGMAEDGVPFSHQEHAPLKFGLGQPLLTLPLYWLGRGWAALAHVNPVGLTHFGVALWNQAAIPLTAAVLFWGARRRYGGRVALALAGTFLLATPAIPYARLAFAEPTSGLLILIAWLVMWDDRGLDQATRARLWTIVRRRWISGQQTRTRWIVAGFCLGLAVLVKPANSIYVPVALVYCIWRIAWEARTALAGSAGPRAWRQAVVPRWLLGLTLFSLGLLPGLALTLVYNYIRYQNPFIFGYEAEGFTTPLPTGLYGLILSPGKGILWFAPPVILTVFGLIAFWRSQNPFRHAEVAAIGAQAAIVLVFHALWSSWEGNIAWGPRLILPVVPLLLWPLGALAADMRARRAWWLLGAVGLLVNIPGALIDQFYYFNLYGVYDAGTQAEANMLFDPLWSQIVAHWRFLLTGTREAVWRPTLTGLGLPPLWDSLVPAALALVCIGALAVGLRGVKRET